MSKYTIEIKEYIESFSHYNQLKFPLSHAEKIEIGRKELFDFDYPIFDINYKKVFETHFIRKFYMREIGFETMGLFKFQLETWLIINMPYFNKLFESEMIKFDPLINAEMDVTHNKKSDKKQNDSKDTTLSSETTGTSNSKTNQTSENNATGTRNTNGTVTDDNFNRDLESNNPDSRLSISANDGEGVIEYASNIKENNENNKRTSNNKVDDTTHSDSTDNATNDTTASSNASGTQKDTIKSDINETEDFIQHRTGKIGVQTYSKMIMEYRESFLRIENMIFKEMQELFMLVY